MPSFIVVPLLLSFAQVSIFIILVCNTTELNCIVMYCIAKKEMRKDECISKPFLHTRLKGTGTVRNENVHQNRTMENRSKNCPSDASFCVLSVSVLYIAHTSKKRNGGY